MRFRCPWCEQWAEMGGERYARCGACGKQTEWERLGKGEDMATSDGESCSAEDRALAQWENQPWGDNGAVERGFDQTRKHVVERCMEAFRAGFRAGQEHAQMKQMNQQPLHLPSLQEYATHEQRIGSLEANMRDLRAAQGQRIESLEEEFAVDGHVHTLEHQLRALERAVFPHDSDGQKSIPARLEALEARLDAPRGLSERLAKLEHNAHDRFEALEAWKIQWRERQRLGDDVYTELHNRMTAIEAKLRLQEPIG